MYLSAELVGFRPLPEALQQPLLAILPGPVFGFLIDNLQHLGKVLEEAGLVLGMLAVLVALGALFGWLQERLPGRWSAAAISTGAWLLVVAVLLPLGGEGPLGLSEGLATPVAWAVLLLLYGVLLQLVFNRTATPLPSGEGRVEGTGEVDAGRRRVLALLPWGMGAAGLLLAGGRLMPGWYRDVFAPPELTAGGPTPELTPAHNFYIVSKNFDDPVVRADGWTLTIDGLVESRRRLDYRELRALEPASEIVTLACISNNVGGPLISTGRFTGVRLQQLLREAAAKPRANTVVFRARDGFTESLPLRAVLESPEILVAWDLNDAPLSSRHGFPARVLIPGRYGMKQPKWLQQIELSETDPGGYWEGQGWDRDAIVNTTSRFDTPRDGFILRRGAIDLAGIAFAGSRGISAVEISSDGGQSWFPATLRAPLSPFAWVAWRATWSPEKEGAYTLSVRARDGAGALQSVDMRPSFPSGSTGLHSIRVNVAR